MEFADYCQQQVSAVETILKEQTVQYDKYGEEENVIDLSFETLSNKYIEMIDKDNNNEDNNMLNDTMEMKSFMAGGAQKPAVNNSTSKKIGDTKKDLLNNTMEAKSLALKHTDSKKQGKVRSIKGNS